MYRLDSDHLLFVATDRISAFDYVLATGIPQQGPRPDPDFAVLVRLSRDIVPNHLVTADVNRYPAAIRKYADELRGRSMMVMRAEMCPGRVRGARLSFRLGMEGVQSDGQGLRHQAARRTEGIRPAAGAHVHARDQGDNRTRHQHFVRRDVPSWSIPN